MMSREQRRTVSVALASAAALGLMWGASQHWAEVRAGIEGTGQEPKPACVSQGQTDCVEAGDGFNGPTYVWGGGERVPMEQGYWAYSVDHHGGVRILPDGADA